MSVRILIGDVRERLREMPNASVQCVVTSPPYWGLRDYGVVGQLGLEPTPQVHVAAMVDVFREVRRVLRPDGIAWVNYGDSYATSANGRSAADTKAAGNDDRTFRDKPFSTVIGGLKAKDLCMVPFRFAMAMQQDGWWLRSILPWVKRNGMPESITDRPATAVEYLFLFSKSGTTQLWRHRDSREWAHRRPKPDYRWRDRKTKQETTEAQAGDDWTRINLWRGFDYFYDADAVRRERTGDEDANGFRGGSYVGGEPGPRTEHGNKRVPRGRSTYGRHTLGDAVPPAEQRTQDGHGRRHAGFNDRWDAAEDQKRGVDPRHGGRDDNHKSLDQTGRGEGRNFRNSDLFFESLAGPHGLLTDGDGEPLALDVPPQPFTEAHFATFPPKLIDPLIKAGSRPGDVILDPFGGAGTTGLVADRLGRDAILIELNPEYAAIAQKRIQGDAPMITSVSVEPAPRPAAAE